MRNIHSVLPACLANVTKTYDANVVALREVSLDIHPGELTALLGPNGAGKTTAVKLLLGLAAPTTGIARVFNADPRDAANRARTGAMLQVARVPETLRVREHIALFSAYYPDPLPFAQVVAAAGLGGIESKKFGELSGGQKQRVLFALAICGNPDLLILDEPTVGLDVEVLRALLARDTSLADIEITSAGLEDAFLAMTSGGQAPPPVRTGEAPVLHGK